MREETENPENIVAYQTTFVNQDSRLCIEYYNGVGKITGVKVNSFEKLIWLLDNKLMREPEKGKRNGRPSR